MPNSSRGLDGEDFGTLWQRALEHEARGPHGPDITVQSYGSRRCFILWPNDPTRRMHIFSHNVGVNTSLTEGLCRDKKLTHSILTTAGIPVVPHLLCMGSQRFGRFPPRTSQWLSSVAFFRSNGCDVVVKPTGGCSGDRVVRVRCIEALEAAVCALDSLPSYVLTPFVPSEEEIRVMIVPVLVPGGSGGGSVGRRVAFLLRKAPLSVTGDGVRTLAELLSDPTTAFPAGADRASIAADLAASTPGLDLHRVVPVGERVSSWKYNESKGAAFEAVHAWGGNARLEAVVRVALGAAAALGLRFGAVDVLVSSVEPSTANPACSCTVLEVNTDVMLDVLELPDAAISAILQEMIACRRILDALCRERRLDDAVRGASGHRDAFCSEVSSAHSTESAVVASFEDDAAVRRPSSFVEKASVKLRCLQAVAGSLELAEVRALDHDYLVIMVAGAAGNAQALQAESTVLAVDGIAPTGITSGAIKTPSLTSALDVSRRIYNTNYDFGITLAAR